MISTRLSLLDTLYRRLFIRWNIIISSLESRCTWDRSAVAGELGSRRYLLWKVRLICRNLPESAGICRVHRHPYSMPYLIIVVIVHPLLVRDDAQCTLDDTDWVMNTSYIINTIISLCFRSYEKGEHVCKIEHSICKHPYLLWAQ